MLIRGTMNVKKASTNQYAGYTRATRRVAYPPGSTGGAPARCDAAKGR